VTASQSASRSSDLDSGERLVVALVRAAHGLRGAVRVEILTDRPEARFRPGSILFREGSSEPLRVTAAAPVADGPGWRVRFEEVADRNAAEGLRGSYLEAVLDPAESLGRGEFFWHEVVGAAVRGVDGTELGRVEDIYRVAETEVLVVRGGPHGDFDVPVVRQLIRIFAPRRGEIVVDGTALDLAASASARDDEPPRRKAPRRRSRRKAVSSAAPSTASSLGEQGQSGSSPHSVDTPSRSTDAMAPVDTPPANDSPD
jgi:16S rRNA processing protein RimM